MRDLVGRSGLVLAGIVAVSGSGAAAQQPLETCGTVYASVYATPARGNACQALAGELVLELTNAFWTQARAGVEMEKTVGAGDLQPVSTGSSSSAGSLAQTEAVPSGQPLSLGGGSVSAVGSDAGADAITSLTFNPLTFLGGDLQRFARDSRISDVTVFFPVDKLDADEDGSIDYFGLRLRVNFTGVSAGQEVWAKATEQFEALLSAETRAAQTLLEMFGSMTQATMLACAQAIHGGSGPDGVEGACGAGLVTPSASDYEAFRNELDVVRTRADSRYVGLDLRMDFGDPTLGAVANASATALNAGIAFGRQFVGPTPDPLAPSAGIRGRIGVRYTDLREMDATSFAADGGVAFVMRRPVNLEQALTLSGGLEFRFGNVDEDLKGEFQSEFLSVRATLTVPLTSQAGVTIGFARPLIGDEVSPTLNITGDWKLILPGLLGKLDGLATGAGAR